MMRFFLLVVVFFLNFPPTLASVCGSCQGQNCPQKCKREFCCDGMGGIQYCDSSSGRLVCNNGYYSSCYCTRHAIMDLQEIEGCCLWQGGVLTIDPLGIVLCRSGAVSEICSGVRPTEGIAAY